MALELQYRNAWNKEENETAMEYRMRIQRQRQQWHNIEYAHGCMYMVVFGPDDVRPMWECEIDPVVMRDQVRTSNKLQYDCVLCQPYDEKRLLGDRDLHRRHLCRVVRPYYVNGCADEVGVFMKCPCLTGGKDRSTLKFKRGDIA